MTSNRLHIQELLEKITEKTNNLPPPIFTEKCCEFYKQLDKVRYISVCRGYVDTQDENTCTEWKIRVL